MRAQNDCTICSRLQSLSSNSKYRSARVLAWTISLLDAVQEKSVYISYLWLGLCKRGNKLQLSSHDPCCHLLADALCLSS